MAAVQDDVYRLAQRMLRHTEDAQGATQEALVMMVTRVDSFRAEASFRSGPTGGGQPSARPAEGPGGTGGPHLRRFTEDLDEGLAEEGKLGCTHRVRWAAADGPGS